MDEDNRSDDMRTGLPPRMERKPGLGSHIRGWMLAVGLVPLAILFAYGYTASRVALVAASDEHLLSVVGARKAQIELWLRERMTDLEVIGRSQDCIALVRESTSHREHAQVCGYLDSFQSEARDYQVLALYDLDWNWVASQSGAEAHRETLVDLEIKKEIHPGGGPVMSAVHHHSELGIGLHAANVLQMPGDAPAGYVVASVDLTGTFAPILGDRAGLELTGRVLLADSGGALLLTGAREADEGAVLDSEVVRAAAAAQAGTVHYRRSSGERVFAGFTTLPQRGWVLVAEMDQGEALGLLHSLRRGFLIAGLITLIGVIILSAHIGRRLSTPLAALATAARHIKGANPHERLPVSGGQEVADVGRAFNETLDALEETQRQRIQAGALAAVGELSSNVVHEMRNRLSSVKMNLQALGRRLTDEDDYAELARIALEQVHRTEETLTELLNYARPVQPVKETVIVERVLSSLAEQFRAEAASRTARIEVDDRTGGAAILADRKLLAQAVSNVVRNALEATPQGGCITLRAVPHQERDGWLDLEVEDDGPGLEGIPPEEIFQPFFTTKERGAGLGLAQARKITELHGGRILALSGSRGGALIRLELPWQEARA